MALRIALYRALNPAGTTYFDRTLSAHYAHIVVVAVAIAIRSGQIFCALPGTALPATHIRLCQLLCTIAHVDTLMPTVPHCAWVRA